MGEPRTRSPYHYPYYHMILRYGAITLQSFKANVVRHTVFCRHTRQMGRMMIIRKVHKVVTRLELLK